MKMTTTPKIWKKGNRKPKNWPEWLKDADIAWCIVEVDVDGSISWLDGHWLNGVWDGADDGILNGSRTESHWHAGIFEDGDWRGGTWENGTWKNGTWWEGTWYGGTWENGSWHKGSWYGGTWKNGHSKIRNRGAWMWETGTDLVTSNITEETKTIHEWRAELASQRGSLDEMEFRLLCFWIDLQKEQDYKPSDSPTLWDHIGAAE